MKLLNSRRFGVVALVVGVGVAVLLTGSMTAMADTTPQSLPFTQSWTNTGLITANDNWSGVPGVEGFLGQDITTSTGTDPQTLLTTSSVANDLDVIANQTNTALTNGGVAEFELANPTIALQGSGTADAPYILLTLDATGLSSLTVSYNLRDIDGTTDNAVQPVALQYRVGASGNFTNVPAGFVADATTGPSLASLVTPVNATLPANADDQSLVQVRVITSNAVGSDEWVGIDDLSVTGSVADTPPAGETVKVWVGLKNSDDAGTTFDLRAVDSDSGASGELDGFSGGSSGFNNAHLATIQLSGGNAEDDHATLMLFVRISCTSRHASGTARLWWNDSQANSRIEGGGFGALYLRGADDLVDQPGSARMSRDVVVKKNGCPGNTGTWQAFGSWTGAVG